MGYVAVPSVLHTRTLYRPHTTPGTFGVLTGVGGDTGLVVWYSHKLLSWVITRTDQEGLPFDCVISLAGRTLSPRALINESPAWGDATYTLYKFNNGKYRLVPNDYAGAIIEPPVNTQWWEGSTGAPDSMMYNPKGAATGDYQVSNINAWVYWTSPTKTGLYEPKGAATGGPVLVGTGRWTDNLNGVYVQNMEYSELALGVRVMGFSGMTTADGVNWVIGTVGSPDGWWEGPTPNPNASVTFTFKQLLDGEGEPVDPELSQPNRTVTYAGVTDDVKDTRVLLTSTPIWRG